VARAADDKVKGQIMSKKLAIILIVVAFLVGAIGGGWSIGYFYNRLTTRLVCNTETARAVMDMAALNRIRSNNVTNAIKLLETELDGSMITLGLYLKDIPKSQLDADQLKALRRIKDYRDKFPHTNEYPELNRIISNALLLADVETNK
jgi:uncharacterized protein YneF (UPF0154 family)